MTLLNDAIQTGLLYDAQNLCSLSVLVTAISATRFLLFALESQTKRTILREPYDKLSPEETAGFFGVAFFWWVNKVLRTGYSNVLSLDEMPPLGKALDSMKTRAAMQREWDRRSKCPCVSPDLPTWTLANQTQENQKDALP